MTAFEIICLLILVLSLAATCLICVLLKRQRDTVLWTRCKFCGIYFDTNGNTCQTPMEGMVRRDYQVCGPCLNNEEPLRAHAR